MEYVIVQFGQDRAVFVDDQQDGRTDQNIYTSAGTHTFTLGGDKKSSPEEVACAITNTTVLKPCIMHLEVGGHC